MNEGSPQRIKVTIYPNQLKWMEEISKTMHQPRRQTFLRCFAEYIGAYKEQVKRPIEGKQA